MPCGNCIKPQLTTERPVVSVILSENNIFYRLQSAVDNIENSRTSGKFYFFKQLLIIDFKNQQWAGICSNATKMTKKRFKVS